MPVRVHTSSVVFGSDDDAANEAFRALCWSKAVDPSAARQECRALPTERECLVSGFADVVGAVDCCGGAIEELPFVEASSAWQSWCGGGQRA
jgi:hypothetical protein